MKMLTFAVRNRKELTRDPLSIFFGIGLPVLLLIFVSALNRNIIDAHVTIFEMQNFTPGIAMFSLSFIALFSGMLLANDRGSSLLARLFASPLTARDYIIGYSLPLIPIAVLQSTVCFAAAVVLGLPVSWRILLSILVLLPVALLFIGFGLLLGSLLSSKQIGPISSILVQIAVFSSGTWFDLEMIGGTLKTICYALPFAHAVKAAQEALTGDLSAIGPHLLVVGGYTVVIFGLAVAVFRKKMKG